MLPFKECRRYILFYSYAKRTFSFSHLSNRMLVVVVAVVYFSINIYSKNFERFSLDVRIVHLPTGSSVQTIGWENYAKHPSGPGAAASCSFIVQAVLERVVGGCWSSGVVCCAAAPTNLKVNVKAGASADSNIEAMDKSMKHVIEAESKSEAFLTGLVPKSNFDNDLVTQTCQARDILYWKTFCLLFRNRNLYRKWDSVKVCKSFAKVYLGHYILLDFREATNNKLTA